MLGCTKRLNLVAAHAPPRVLSQGPKAKSEYLPKYKTLHCVGTACTAFPQSHKTLHHTTGTTLGKASNTVAHLPTVSVINSHHLVHHGYSTTAANNFM